MCLLAVISHLTNINNEYKLSLFIDRLGKRGIIAFWLTTREYKKYNNINKENREELATGLYIKCSLTNP